MFRSTLQGLIMGIGLAIALLIPARAHADASQPVILMSFGGGYDGGTLPHCVQYFGTGKLFLYTCDNIETMGTGYFLFDSNGAIHMEPETNLCLDVWGNVGACNGSTSQQWYFVNGLVRPRWASQFQGCLTVESGPSASLDGTPVDVAPCNGSASQLFAPISVDLMLENPVADTCLFSSISPLVPIGTAPCNTQDRHQAFYFNFDNSSGEFYLLLETGAGGNQCLTFDGTSGDPIYLDRNDCNATSYNNPSWERWQYMVNQLLMNSTRAGRFNHLCLTQGNLLPGTQAYTVTESNCLIGVASQKWITWIKGFPSGTLPIIIRPPGL
jgi:hypothetical protein